VIPRGILPVRMMISSRNIFIFCISLPFVLSSRYGRGDYQLGCLNIDCSRQYVESCCTARHQGVGRSLQPLANWRFGSIFRNSIPPVRPYKVPSFEDIFETDHSSRTDPEPASPQNPSPGVLGGNLKTPSSQNLFQLSNILSENNRNSQNSNSGGGASELLSKLSKHQALHEAFFETTTKPYPTSTRSYEELRKMKLIEMAKEELRKKQQMKDQYIRAQQKKNEFLKIMRQQQKQQEQTKQIEHLQKEPRSQDLDNFFTKVKDFDSAKTSLKDKLNHELIKRYQDKLMKKSNQEKQYSEKLQRWKQDKKQETSAKWSKINGQNYVDMSDGTIIMDNNEPEKPQVSSQSQQDLHGSSQSLQVRHRQSHQSPVTQPASEMTREAVMTPAPTKSPMFQDRIKHEDISENETENIVKEATKSSKNDVAEVFTEELCDKLRVPCRFVTEHPCCQLPQDIGMVGRPRAMDGSADLKWRFYQSRKETRGGQLPGRGRSKGDGRMLPGFSAGYNSNIPYNSWSSARDIRVPRYFYDGGPDLTSTILSQCWRLIYINCLQDRDHPCCGLTNRSDRLANNVIDRWLRRY